MRVEIKVDMKALEDLSRAVSSGKAHDRINKGVQAGAFLIRSTAQRKILSGPKTGRMYGKHRASAPGQSPASDTGRLVQGIVVEPADEPLAFDVKSLADYAGFLEYGTSRMAPRPYLEPSAKEQADNVAKLTLDALEF